MTSKSVKLLASLAAALAAVPFALHAQQPDVDREMEDAKALYRDASFTEAIAKLQDVVGRLTALRDLEAKKAQLADAHLHLALSYSAIENAAAAKESLKAMLRLDRQRRLDPRIYAPPILGLLEEARAEVLKEPAPSAPAAPRPSPSAQANKGGGGKVALIVLGAGAAIGGGVAVAGGGGAGPPGTTTPTPTPTPTPLPVRATSLTTSPPPGGTVNISNGERLEFRVTVVSTTDFPDVSVHACLYESSGELCGCSGRDVLLHAGVPQTFDEGIQPDLCEIVGGHGTITTTTMAVIVCGPPFGNCNNGLSGGGTDVGLTAFPYTYTWDY